MHARNLLRSRTAWALGAAVAAAALVRADARSVIPELAATPVTVSNPIVNPALMHEVDNPAESPFAIRVNPTQGATASFVVPAGKRLVITSVSGFAYSTTVMSVTVFAMAGTAGGNHVVPFGQITGGVSYITQGSMMLVADPGSTVYFTLDDSNYADEGGVNIDVYGYFTSY